MVVTTRSSTMSLLGLVIMRLVKPAPGPVVRLATTLAPTKSTFGTVGVSDPLLVVVLEPVAPTPPTSGLTGSSPLYSRIRISGKDAATLKRTVTMLLLAAAAEMFGAKKID